MCTAMSLLITNKVNIWREIEADGAGLVVNDDLDGVAAGLQAMCALPEAERDAMGRRGRACFMRRYDLEENAMSLLVLLQRLAREPEAGAQERLAIA